MNCIPDSINTLIFDLGGVIVDLAPERTLHEFGQLASLPANRILDVYNNHNAFHAYETGRIGDGEFRDEIRDMFNIKVTDEAIDRCWNAMLLGISAAKLTMLTVLKKHFTTIALSNTNAIHLAYINEIILDGKVLDPYFHYAHYSHNLGMRKPDAEIYAHVLAHHSLNPKQAFFMDDNADNIRAAKALGIETMLIEHPDRVTDLFTHYA